MLEKITMLLVRVIALTDIKLFFRAGIYRTLVMFVMFISQESIFIVAMPTPWMVWFSPPTILMFLLLLSSI
jgi:hypothetical protein